jgi:DNA-binding PadR family transcriptional regulator
MTHTPVALGLGCVSAMREYSSGEVTPHEAVLGLIALGRSTVAALHGRLDKEFPHANLPPNTARTGLTRLARKGHVRLVREGEERAQDLYEITELGLRRSEELLYEAVSIPAPLRDALQAKLAFVRPHAASMGKLIDVIGALEDAAADQFGIEHGKINALNIGRRVEGNPQLELQRIRLKYTATIWGQEAKRLASLRKELEDFRERLWQRETDDR